MMLAQLEARAGNMAVAWAAADQMTSWFKTRKAAAERRDREQQVIVLLEEHKE
jgi:hypothetical protein